jgi:hypothetical protein
MSSSFACDDRHDRLRYAIGTFAAHLAGQANEARVQEAECTETTEALRREHGSEADGVLPDAGGDASGCAV